MSKTSEDKSVFEPRFTVFNAYSLVAAAYCASFSWIYFTFQESELLGYVHLVGLSVAVAGWIFAFFTKKYSWGIRLIVADGAMVVSFLFATGGWEGSGYLWPFAYLPYAVLLTSRREGIFWMVSLFIVWLSIFGLSIYRLIEIPYTNVQILNYFLSYLIFAFCVYIFQSALDRYRQSIALKQMEIELDREKIMQANRDIEASKEAAYQKTKELEKLNSFMIGREAKMAELKKRIEELEGKKG